MNGGKCFVPLNSGVKCLKRNLESCKNIIMKGVLMRDIIIALVDVAAGRAKADGFKNINLVNVLPADL